MDLVIFENKELQEITDLSDRIVNTLSNNYEYILQAIPKKQNTRNTYIRCAGEFIAFIQTNGINSLSFGAFRNALDELDVSASTKKLRIAAAKALLQESVKHGILPIDITANVPSFKQSKDHKKEGLNEQEVKRVLEHIGNIKKDKTRIRINAMCHLLIFEGLRQFEVRDIKLSDINLADKTILIKGKGADDQSTVMIIDRTVEALKNYITTLPEGTVYLFESTKKVGHPVSLRYVRKLWTCPTYGIFAKCGIFGRSTHGFRHFFTTKTLEITGGDIGKTRRRTRHKVDATVQTYDDRRLKRKEVEEIQKGFDF